MPRQKDPFAVEMGQRVIAAAESQEISIPELATLVNVEYNTLSRALAGWHRIQYEVLCRLARVLHRSLYYFFGLPDPRDLDPEEDEIINIRRAYRTAQMKRYLKEDALRYLEAEEELLPTDSAEQ